MIFTKKLFFLSIFFLVPCIFGMEINKFSSKGTQDTFASFYFVNVENSSLGGKDDCSEGLRKSSDFEFEKQASKNNKEPHSKLRGIVANSRVIKPKEIKKTQKPKEMKQHKEIILTANNGSKWFRNYFKEIKISNTYKRWALDIPLAFCSGFMLDSVGFHLAKWSDEEKPERLALGFPVAVIASSAVTLGYIKIIRPFILKKFLLTPEGDSYEQGIKKARENQDLVLANQQVPPTDAGVVAVAEVTTKVDQLLTDITFNSTEDLYGWGILVTSIGLMARSAILSQKKILEMKRSFKNYL